MTLETIETTEELLFINNEKDFDESRGDARTVEGGARMQSVQSEQVTSHSQEVKKKYVIRSITDPLTSQEVSIQDAIAKGSRCHGKGNLMQSRNWKLLDDPRSDAKKLDQGSYF